MLAPPLLTPQAASVTSGEVKMIAGDSVMVTLLVALQLFASLTVTVKTVAFKFVTVIPLAALLQLYVRGAVPPLALTTALPVLAPLHNTLVGVMLLIVGAPILVIVAVDVFMQLFASVTVTVYVAEGKPLAVKPLAPLLQV